MKAWIDRFFKLNRDAERELEGVTIEQVKSALDQLSWRHSDEFWSPDLQVDQFHRGEAELFVIQETYFSPKLTGAAEHISEVESTCATPEIR